ncbi:MAG: hypothetical protein LBI72_06040 [Flavobacteriaceae bacterium]|jgi:hypothetical protein|nr:hypothetical protein [Flavobacteriaceae bacterium]
MEWHEIEEKLQKKASEKEITPSANAWDKLSTQLDEYTVVEKRSNLKLWIGIAASLLIGGFLISLFVFRQNEVITPYVIQQNTNNAIVETDSVKVEQEKKETKKALHEEDKSIIPSIKEKYKRVEELQQALVQKEESPVIIVPILSEDVKETEPITVDLLPISVVKPTQKVVVNSKELLKQVEGEIVVEYRESVVKKIYEKTKKVIVDISDSNYEK